MRLMSVLLGLLVLSSHSQAHHQTSGQYSDETVDVEGEVVRVIWGNPHPRLTLKVRTESGEEELLHFETGGLGDPTRSGISRGAIRVGDSVRVAGRAPLRGTRYDFSNVLLPNGKELVFRGAEPRWSSDAQVSTNNPLALAVDEAKVEVSRANARGLFRVWVRSGGGAYWNQDLPLTEAARASLAVFDFESEYPIMKCVPPGMPRATITNPWPMEFVERENNIVQRMEEFDIERTIHMNPGARNNSPTPTPLGFSVGRWEDGSLVVVTTDVNWPYFDDTGIPLTEEVEILERFTLSSNETDLDYQITVTDPDVFTRPVIGATRWTWVPGLELRPYECIPDD